MNPVRIHSQQIMALMALWEKAPLPVKLLFEILEAGLLFDDVPGFSVSKLLKEMDMDGSETFASLAQQGRSVAGFIQSRLGIDRREPVEAAEPAEEN